MAIFTSNLSSHVHVQALAHLSTNCGHSCNHPFSATHSNNALMGSKLQKYSQLRIRSVKRNTSAASDGVSLPAVTLYDILCVPHSVELGELKKAYREKVRVYHPDVCPPDEREEACKMFLQVQEAYKTLSDPMLRADYDFNLNFTPHTMLLQRRNNGSVRDEGKQQWAQQLQRLNRSSKNGMVRDSWGARMRRFKKAAAHDHCI